MARPLRRVLIGLSVRLGLSIREVESWDIPTIREFMAYLMELHKKPEPESSEPPTVEEKLLAHPMFATQKE